MVLAILGGAARAHTTTAGTTAPTPADVVECGTVPRSFQPSSTPSWSGPAATDEADRLERLATSDQDLLARARQGDHDAVARLYAEHRPAALRLAGRLCDQRDVEDVVADAFSRVLAQLADGRGPLSSFRAYLLMAVRHSHVDHVRRDARLVWTDEVDEGDAPARPDTAPARAESDVLARAMRALPVRWQLVLWWTIAESRGLDEVGRRLGLTPNAAAALAFRAREGLRLAYLDEHVDAGRPPCESWRSDLVAHVRGRLPRGRLAALERHLDTCASCDGASAALRPAGRSMPALVGAH